MREVKFRLWLDNEMLSHEQLIRMDQDTHAMYTIITKEKQEEGTVLMQYTGLKDKDGVEIFEGDVLRRVSEEWDVDAVYKVVWGGIDYPAWDVKPWYEGESNFFSDYENADEWGTLEIIGNIYENPELLNKS